MRSILATIYIPYAITYICRLKKYLVDKTEKNDLFWEMRGSAHRY